MSKPSISIERDIETLRGLTVLSDPTVPPASHHPQRDETDVSLRVERDRKDDRDLSTRDEADATADAVVQVARDRADEVLQVARDAADSERCPGPSATELGSVQKRERAQADVELGLARATADAVLGHERVKQRRALAESLGLERDATDTSLTGERGDSDSMIVELREANAKMVGATLLAQELAGQADEAKNRAQAIERELRAVAEFREMFIGVLAHDLRNPLNTMVMATGLLTAHGRLTPEDARLVNRISNSGHRMARMITQVVDFTRARLGGGFDLIRAPSDLATICRDIAEELRISSSAEIHQTTTGDVLGTWDADRLAQALSNLVGNAVGHASPNTPVTIHGYGEDRAVAVEVTNQGVAIPDDELPLLFLAYRRGKPRGASDSGHLGLGLYIASEIVCAHGGTLAAGSKDGFTTFTLRLPRELISPAAASSRRVDER